MDNTLPGRLPLPRFSDVDSNDPMMDTQKFPNITTTNVPAVALGIEIE